MIAFGWKRLSLSLRINIESSYESLFLIPNVNLRAIPAIKIGRLAIDKTYKGKGLGSLIIHNIINDCLELNERQACRLITIDAYKQSVSFYEKLGFISFTEKDKDENIRQMFLDLSKIQN